MAKRKVVAVGNLVCVYYSIKNGSGRGSVWLERDVRDVEVGGSNPLAPTNFNFQDFSSGLFARFPPSDRNLIAESPIFKLNQGVFEYQEPLSYLASIFVPILFTNDLISCELFVDIRIAQYKLFILFVYYNYLNLLSKQLLIWLLFWF